MQRSSHVAPRSTAAHKSARVHSIPKREFRRRPVRYVRRGQVGDRRPNKLKKGIEASLAETIFLATPTSYVKPENSLHDHFLRMRLQHWDTFRAENPDKQLPETIPYEIDRVPTMWPDFNKYCKNELGPADGSKPLIFYRKQWLRYDEPSFIHVVKVADRLRQNKYGRSTVLTAWKTWRGVTHPFPSQVTSRRKNDWRRLDPALGFMTSEIWKGLQEATIKPYFLPRPAYMNDELEPAYLEAETKRMDDLIESTKSKVV